MLNRVILIGRLGRDPELRYTPSGIPVCQFSIAVQRPVAPNEQGERETDWIDIVAWRERAETAANYLAKGRLVAIEGRLQIRSWVAQDGTKRKAAEVVADHLRMLEPRRDQAPTAGEEREPAYAGDGKRSGPDGGTQPPDPFAEE